MPAIKQDLYIEQGADFVQTFFVKDNANQAIDLTGYSAISQIRPYKSSSFVMIDGTSSNGVLVITPLTGKIEMILTGVQTSLLQFSKCVYDLYLEKPSGELLRYAEGEVTVSLSVTR